MGYESVYKYFRPTMMLCYFVGLFSARNVTTDSSHQLVYTFWSFPLLSAILHLLDSYYVFVSLHKLYSKEIIPKDHHFLLIHHIGQLIVKVVISIWFLRSSKNIIKAFKFIDKLIMTLEGIPESIRPERIKPTKFALTVFGLFIGVHLSVFLKSLIFYYKSTPTPRYYSHVLEYCLPFRVAILLSVFTYGSSIGIQMTVKAWNLFSRLNCRPWDCLGEFNRLVIAQTELFNELVATMKSYILVLFAYRIFCIFNYMFFRVYTSPILPVTVFDLSLWTVSLAALVLCSGRPNEQYRIMAGKVLKMSTSSMSKPDAFKTRLLLAQLSGAPGHFTAADFVLVRPSLFLSFLSVGLEYFVFFLQNIEQLRRWSGIRAFGLITAVASNVTTANYSMTTADYNTTTTNYDVTSSATTGYG